jgi:hypothetical protein
MKKNISEKRKQYLKEYREKNRKELLEKKRIFNDNPENKIKAKEYREKNKEKLKERYVKYYESKKNDIIENNKKYYVDNKDKVLERTKKYRKENIGVIRLRKSKYERDRNKRDPLYRLKTSIRSIICAAFRKKGYSKKTKTHLILGCSFDEFKNHIENQFEGWMCWDNRGLYNGTEKYGWDIDHIIPLRTAITEEDVIRLNHYTNLRPLCSYYNRDIKSGNLIL